MRFLTISAVVCMLAGVAPASAGPITISTTFDWSSQSYSDAAAPQWSHTLAFAPDAGSILSATIDIRHAGNNLLTESWSLKSQSDTAIGNLSQSWLLVDFFRTDTFTVPVSLFPSLPTASWVLALKLTEGTSNTDSISVDWARLNVTYEPVAATQTPEPATLTLLGTGVAAALWRRRRQRNQIQPLRA
jgi:hypothetical protein